MDTSGSGEQEQFVSRKKEKDFQGLPLFAREHFAERSPTQTGVQVPGIPRLMKYGRYTVR
jgi:hypothetical protein